MAEKGPCPGLDASLRSEDLLSDMEPLPLSAPATPAQPFGSEVTAQLYTSLRRSRQAELDACSQLQPPDLDALAEELNRTLSVGVEASARRKVRRGDVGPLTPCPLSAPGPCRSCPLPAQCAAWRSCFPATPACAWAPPLSPRLPRSPSC
uniref:Uncharacterized protein n=1 Tax=Chrysemys picta bellii TaxID=8478 RepID=A0A8C3HCW0_CHRPI